MTTTPFTYYLYHRPTGLKYYGVRYRQHCQPRDLWTTYFTSSTYVADLIKQYGKDSFDVEIRKIFDTPEAATIWETKVLRRLKVLQKDDWLNKNIAGNIVMTEEIKLKISKTLKENPNRSQLGKKCSEETKAKMREAKAKRKALGLPGPNSGKTMSKEGNQKRSEKLKNRKLSDETKSKISLAATGRKRTIKEDGSVTWSKCIDH
jgi:hypothetical protein